MGNGLGHNSPEYHREPRSEDPDHEQGRATHISRKGNKKIRSRIPAPSSSLFLVYHLRTKYDHQVERLGNPGNVRDPFEVSPSSRLGQVGSAYEVIGARDPSSPLPEMRRLNMQFLYTPVDIPDGNQSGTKVQPHDRIYSLRKKTSQRSWISVFVHGAGVLVLPNTK